MQTAGYVYWQEGDFLLGYFEDYPDSMTQGESPEDLQDQRRDLRCGLIAEPRVTSTRREYPSATGTDGKDR